MTTVALALLLGGCVSRGEVTLLPGENGAPDGAVAVLDSKTGAERGVIDRANTEAALGKKKLKARSIKPGKFALLSMFMPPPAHHFVIYFLEGSTTLAPGSEAVLNVMFKELTLRSGAEVEVIGHTDTVGSEADNDALSLKRAQEISTALVTMGHLDLSITSFSGRGERELLVATPDDTAEAHNRRVEIVVR